jgi:hypothetical protein
MNKNDLMIGLFVVLVVISISTIFVFKARGSNERELAEGCVPYNVSVQRGGEYEAIVEWMTEDECLGYISYGDNRNNLDFIAVDTESLSSNYHRIEIDKLLPSQNYFFVIRSGDKTYGNRGVALSFSLSSL